VCGALRRRDERQGEAHRIGRQPLQANQTLARTRGDAVRAYPMSHYRTILERCGKRLAGYFEAKSDVSNLQSALYSRYTK